MAEAENRGVSSIGLWGGGGGGYNPPLFSKFKWKSISQESRAQIHGKLG